MHGMVWVVGGAKRGLICTVCITCITSAKEFLDTVAVQGWMSALGEPESSSLGMLRY